MQLGRLEESERRDFARAAELYARAEKTGKDLLAVWSARARVAAALDDERVELQMLRKLTEGDDEQRSPERTDALYRLADLELANRDTMRAGVETLGKALEAEPRYEHAARALQDALVLEPDSEGRHRRARGGGTGRCGRHPAARRLGPQGPSSRVRVRTRCGKPSR